MTLTALPFFPFSFQAFLLLLLQNFIEVLGQILLVRKISGANIICVVSVNRSRDLLDFSWVVILASQMVLGTVWF